MLIMHQRAFGKLARDNFGEVIRWHPLVDHMIDVAACFECLSTCHSIRRAMKKAAGRELNERDIARLSVLVFCTILAKPIAGFKPNAGRIRRTFLKVGLFMRGMALKQSSYFMRR